MTIALRTQLTKELQDLLDMDVSVFAFEADKVSFEPDTTSLNLHDIVKVAKFFDTEEIEIKGGGLDDPSLMIIVRNFGESAAMLKS